LQEAANNDITRIGLSATQAPIDEIAKYLVGYNVEEDISIDRTEYDEEIKASDPKDKEEYESRGCNIVDVAASKKKLISKQFLLSKI